MGWILRLSPSFLHEELGIHITQPIVAGLFACAVVFTNGLTQVILRRHHEKAGMLRLGVALIPFALDGTDHPTHRPPHPPTTPPTEPKPR